MTTLGGLTFTYIAHERQARAAAVERLLGRATTLLDQARGQPDDPVRWRTALAAVQQVEDDPAGIAPEARDRLARLKTDAASGLRDAERDATLRQALVEVRANQQDAGLEATDAAYAGAFRAAGLDLDALSVTEAPIGSGAGPRRWSSSWPRTSTIGRTCAARPGGRRPRGGSRWRLARAADADAYRDRLRDLLAADDRKAAAAQLKALADEPRGGRAARPDGGAARRRPGGAGDREAAVGLLRRAAARHPGRRLGQLRPGRGPATADAGAARGGGAVLHGGAGPAARDGARPGPPARARWAAAPRPRPPSATWSPAGPTPRGTWPASAGA